MSSIWRWSSTILCQNSLWILCQYRHEWVPTIGDLRTLIWVTCAVWLPTLCWSTNNLTAAPHINQRWRHWPWVTLGRDCSHSSWPRSPWQCPALLSLVLCSAPWWVAMLQWPPSLCRSALQMLVEELQELLQSSGNMTRKLKRLETLW